MSKTAVVLFNLGGPDSPKAVKPFLMNLFNDRAIIPLPQPLRYFVAMMITTLRHSKAQGIYKHMGGKSPLLPLTTEQANALEAQLNGGKSSDEFKVFVCMRYWHPMTDVVVKKVKAYVPDRVVLLPLYPQFSTTTTGSSLDEWKKQSKAQKFDVPTSAIGCYPTDKHFIAAHVKLIKEMYWKASENGKPRVLFSAHGLPQKVIDAGDPYQWQVEKTVEGLTKLLAVEGLDYAICYQSKVGKMEWIGPSTEDEIRRAGEEHVPVLVVPVAFVSEHSETLVELDIDFRQLAEECGVEGYYRVQALNSEPFFIEALAELVRSAPKGGNVDDMPVMAAGGKRICPAINGKCLCEG